MRETRLVARPLYEHVPLARYQYLSIHRRSSRCSQGPSRKEPSSLETTSSLRWGDLGKFEARLKSYEQGEITEVDWLDR